MVDKVDERIIHKKQRIRGINSSINFENIKSREQFYSAHDMIWVLNGATLAAKTKIVYDIYEYHYDLTVSVPKIFTSVSAYDLSVLVQ